VGAIKAADLLTTLRRIEKRGALDTAHRAHQNSGQIFRYAVATGRAERDPSGDLRGALAPAKPSHYPTITDPDKIGVLLRAIDGYSGSQVVRIALKLAPLVFVRPGELRAARMKMGEQPIVPLSRQAVEILREIRPLTSRWRYVFPSLLTRDRPMSENTVNAALRRMGYSGDDQTGHGFRSMASTLLNEQGFPPDVIELQLAHAERNKVRAAYNKAQRLGERRNMMQWWADYLDALRASTTQGGKDSLELDSQRFDII